MIVSCLVTGEESIKLVRERFSRDNIFDAERQVFSKNSDGTVKRSAIKEAYARVTLRMWNVGCRLWILICLLGTSLWISFYQLLLFPDFWQVLAEQVYCFGVSLFFPWGCVGSTAFDFSSWFVTIVTTPAHAAVSLQERTLSFAFAFLLAIPLPFSDTTFTFLRSWNLSTSSSATYSCDFLPP